MITAISFTVVFVAFLIGGYGVSAEKEHHRYIFVWVAIIVAWRRLA